MGMLDQNSASWTELLQDFVDHAHIDTHFSSSFSSSFEVDDMLLE